LREVVEILECTRLDVIALLLVEAERHRQAREQARPAQQPPLVLERLQQEVAPRGQAVRQAGRPRAVPKAPGISPRPPDLLGGLPRPAHAHGCPPAPRRGGRDADARISRGHQGTNPASWLAGKFTNETSNTSILVSRRTMSPLCRSKRLSLTR